jgi:hypothetical protein
MIPRRNKQLLKGLDDMCKYLQSQGVKEIIEVGSWCGSGASVMAKYFDKVTCIDPWEPTANTISARYSMEDVEKEFDKVMAKHSNIRKVKARIENVALFPTDCIYIDADHHYKHVKENIEQCLPFCEMFIAGHDYWLKKFPGVVKAVNERFKKPDKIFSDTSWIKKV